MKEVELKVDSPIEQKWVLFQFASKSGKYVSGETIGIKICGAFSSEDELNDKAQELYSSGQIYFKMEQQKLGHWLSFPDYSLDNREEKDFIHATASNKFGNTFDLNEMYKKTKENSSIKEKLEKEKKDVIKKSTYFYQPDTKEDLDYLVNLIIESLYRYHNDYTFFKNILSNNTKDYHNALNEKDLPKEQEFEVDEETDYLSLSADPTSAQQFALFSFAHDNSRQKSKTFSFKVRGVFNTIEEFNKRKEFLFKEDSYFDMYNFPVGVWVAFNNVKPQEEATSELNVIVGKEIKKQINKKREFERRVKNLGKDSKDDTIILTKEDIKKNIDHCVDEMKFIKKEMDEYYKMLDKNKAFYLKNYKMSKELEEKIEDILTFES